MSRPSRRRALLIGTETYADSHYTPLPSVAADTWLLEQVLGHRQIGDFWPVRRVADLTTAQMGEEIAQFLGDCEEDELVVLYLSGHGQRCDETGEFCFITADTDSNRLIDTALPAGAVNRLLENCVARQKIVTIDCCESGGFAVGFRTSDAKGPSAQPEDAVLTSSGVCVLSSSRAGEASFAGEVTADGISPSGFTGEVIKALTSGKAARDGSGLVSVVDLYTHVCERMRAAGKQIPVMSVHNADDRIVIASCPLGAEPQLVPLTPKRAKQSKLANGRGAQPIGWPELIAHYRICVAAAAQRSPLLGVASPDYVCLNGPEQLLTGELDSDDSISLPADAGDLLGRMAAEGGELWTGYPAIYFANYPHGRDRRVFAPLLIRRVEPITIDGVVRLKATGPVLPHPRLAADFLGAEQTAHFVDNYQPTWHAGQHTKMARDIRYVLMEDFGIPLVQELHPERLEPTIDTRTLPYGARNAAVLYLSKASASPTDQLIKDLEELERSPNRIDGTALAALVPEFSRAQTGAGADHHSIQPVTPLRCNAAQDKVIRSAMTRPLTVATGPPGTGKSQLVVNLVATAVAAGESVLVASTNNAAVDEVWRRCTKLVEGAMVRTGSREQRAKESDSIATMLAASAPDINLATAEAELAWANDTLEQWNTEAGKKADCERARLDGGRERRRCASELNLSVVDIARRFDQEEPDSVATTLKSAATARFFGRWKRRRAMKPLGFITPADRTAEKCAVLADFATAESVWRRTGAELNTLADDELLSTKLDEAEKAVAAAALTVFATTVHTTAREGRHAIGELYEKLDSRGEWRATEQALPYLRAWAVTCLRARRFRPTPGLFDLVIVDEASQCAIPYVLPLLFRARRALVIGDPMQLQHIPGLSDEQYGIALDQSGLSASWLENRRLSYLLDSSFHAAHGAAGDALLLDEHFRCHPDIAAVANRLFYGGSLTVLTDMRARPELDGHRAIVWKPVAGNAERTDSGSWINLAEVDEVLAAVESLRGLGTLPANTTIGVVTPFRAQADAIRRKLNGHAVRVGTVHVFQGGECDIMIFSLVASRTMSIHSINWIDRQLNLWNVAITRARSHLIVVGDASVWNKRRITRALIDATGPESGDGTTRARDELLELLYRRERNQPGARAVRLGAHACGYPADVRIDWNDGSITAYLLDKGADDSTTSAQHLRIMLQRRIIQNNAAKGVMTQRIAAWELYE